MENYNNNLGKTIIGVYRYLPRVATAFDRIVKTRAYNSNAISSNCIAFNDITNVANTIINLSQRKITLINLKIITEKALKNIKPQYSKLLILRYVDGKKANEIANILGICLRTFFRQINLAVESFSKALSRLGYGEEKLLEMLEEEKWILSVYEKYQSEETKLNENILEDSAFKNKFKNNLMFEFKRLGAFS